MNINFLNSEKMLERAERSIPLGTQTFSKSKTQFPYGASPFYATHGKGSKLWDVDGNEYIDFANSLAAITLGYSDDDINKAVKDQLEKGTIFSLPTELEIELSEKICEIIPCAEMVRFGKNGSDATAGAIRVSRAFTGRDHVAVCGYHGWQDWYIGSTQRNLGVPESTRNLTHNFIYNDINSLNDIFKKYPGKIACVIMEAMNISEPTNSFLYQVQDLAKKNGAVFILDETITGFRYDIGGAQKYFNITPDLATFGKGMSNGFPISAIAGRPDIMKFFEEVFFSFTFGGETLSIIASLACIKKYQEQNVTEFLKKQGEKIFNGVNNIIKKNNSENIFDIKGHPSWSFFVIKDSNGYSSFQIKTLFMQEMISRGIITIGTHNISYSHNDDDIKKLLTAYEEIIPIMVDAINKREIEKKVRCEFLKPLFKVR